MTSRLPGFYKLTLEDRRRLAAEVLGVPLGRLEQALSAGGLDAEMADKTIENVIGTYALPLALGLNVSVNGEDRVAPMVVEEPSVVAAASNAARIVRAGGGFEAEAQGPVMIGQVELRDIADPAAALRSLEAAEDAIGALANTAVPGLVGRGGGYRGLELRDLGDGIVVAHVLLDCRDAMGANLVNTVAEAIAPQLAEIAGGSVGLRILSNLADRRLVRVRAKVPVDALSVGDHGGEHVRDAIIAASRFAERDPYRAATHNKGIMNGVDAVVVATGNDWRAVEAGAHAWAAQGGSYGPLCTWRGGDDGSLVGELEMPLAVGVVSGSTRNHPGARLALELAKIDSASDLAELCGCVGMASNLAALRALATVGIQRGHMALHARSIAVTAGARGDDVEAIAAEIHNEGVLTLDAATRALRRRTDPPPGE